MSWASHNPEMYDEITRKACILKFSKAVSKMGSSEDLSDEQLDLVIGTMEEHFPKMYDRLISEANKEICDGEADYFTSRWDV